MTIAAAALWLVLAVVPGLVLVAVVRPAAGLAALATTAPAVSLGLVHGWAVALTRFGAPVEPATVLPVALGVPAVVLAVAVRRRGAGLVRGRVGLGRPETVMVGLVSLACLVVWWPATHGATLVPPNDDGTNHGLYVGRILDLHSVDPLQVTVGDLATGTPPGTYYPLAMHTVASLVSALGGGDPGRVLDVAIVLAAAVALPFGMAVLTRRLFPAYRWAAPAAALLAVAFPAFPYYVSYWGGFAMIAGLSLTAPLVDALVAVPDEPRPWAAGLVVGLGLAGIFGLHNTELVTVLLLAALLLVAAWIRVGRSFLRRALPGMAAAAGVLVLYVVPQLGALVDGLRSHADAALLAPQQPWQAFVLAATPFFGRSGVALTVIASPQGTPMIGTTLFTLSCVALAGLAALGCVVAWRRGRQEWVLGLVATIALTWWSAMRAPGADLLTVPWYSRWDRVAINELLFVAPLCAVAAVALARRLTAGRSEVAVAAVAGALVVVPLVPQVVGSRQMVTFAFARASLAGDPERAAFAYLAAHLRPGERVLNDVTDGSGWMWTLDGATPVFPSSSKGNPAWGDRNYLQRHAAAIATDAKVRAIADEWDVRYVYLGPRLFPFRKPALDREALLASPGWAKVYDADGAVVLERTGGGGVSTRRTVGISVAVFVVVRAAQILGVLLAPQRHGRPLLDVLTKADAQWYIRLAENGYAPPPPIGPDGVYTKLPDLAFFPLYPATIKVFSWAVDPRLASVIATLVAGVVAAVLMTLWAIPRAGEVGAVTVVAVWSVWPTSVVLSMGYSEALFSATVAGCLLALQRRAWVWAAFACALAGLTRPVRAALLAALVVALLVRRPPVRSWLPAVLLAPLGLVVSLGHVALVTGRWDGWFWLERTAWKSGFDGGTSFVSAMRSMLPGGTLPVIPTWAVSGFAVLVALALLVWLLLSRPPIEEWVFAVLAFVMGVGGSNYIHCKPRFLLPVLPLWIAPSHALARLPRAVLVLLGVVALGLSVWWSIYLLEVWPRSV